MTVIKEMLPPWGSLRRHLDEAHEDFLSYPGWLREAYGVPAIPQESKERSARVKALLDKFRGELIGIALSAHASDCTITQKFGHCSCGVTRANFLLDLTSP